MRKGVSKFGKCSRLAGVRTFQSVTKGALCQQGHLRFFHASPASAGATGALWRVGKPALLNPVNVYKICTHSRHGQQQAPVGLFVEGQDNTGRNAYQNFSGDSRGGLIRGFASIAPDSVKCGSASGTVYRFGSFCDTSCLSGTLFTSREEGPHRSLLHTVKTISRHRCALQPSSH